jgi:ABC-2 type transport system ATP-binding protein
MTSPAAAARHRAPSSDSGGGSVLTATGLVKRYGDLLAVADVSFTIAPGETYGLLGPNGAGKTTAISMVAGILTPDAGEVSVAGRPMTPRSASSKAEVGYVPQDIALYLDLTARENLRFFASLYGMPRAAARTRVAEVLEVVGLSERAGDTVGKYSGGMRRRLNIAVGLLHRPALLILDEPTVGVDPQSRNAILTNVEALAAEGMAVLYTTHYMEEAERLCDRVGIIDLGRLIAEGTTRELTALVGERDRVRLAASGDLEAAADRLRQVTTVRQVTVTPDGLDLVDDNARTSLPGLLRVVAESGGAVRSITVQEPDLESVFLHLTGKTLRD